MRNKSYPLVGITHTTILSEKSYEGESAGTPHNAPRYQHRWLNASKLGTRLVLVCDKKMDIFFSIYFTSKHG